MRHFRRALVAGLLGLCATPLCADPTTPNDPELTPEEQRAELNQQVADRAHEQIKENVESQRAHDAAVVEREETIRRQKAEYQAQLDAYNAAMERWRADVAACKAGDYSRCGHPGTPAAQ